MHIIRFSTSALEKRTTPQYHIADRYGIFKDGI